MQSWFKSTLLSLVSILRNKIFMCLQCDLSKAYLLKDGKKLKYYSKASRKFHVSFVLFYFFFIILFFFHK